MAFLAPAFPQNQPLQQPQLRPQPLRRRRQQQQQQEQHLVR